TAQANRRETNRRVPRPPATARPGGPVPRPAGQAVGHLGPGTKAGAPPAPPSGAGMAPNRGLPRRRKPAALHWRLARPAGHAGSRRPTARPAAPTIAAPPPPKAHPPSGARPSPSLPPQERA